MTLVGVSCLRSLSVQFSSKLLLATSVTLTGAVIPGNGTGLLEENLILSFLKTGKCKIPRVFLL